MIIGTPLLLVQLISIWVFYDRHVDTITLRMARSLAGEIKIAINHMKDYRKPADLVWILAEMQSNLEFRATFKAGEKLQTKQHIGAGGTVGWALKKTFKENFSQPYVIDTKSVYRHIKVTLQLENGVLEIVTSKKKMSTTTTELFVMWSIGSSVVMLLIAALFMRNQVRPIRRLAIAADSFGKGRDVPDFKPSGATEVRRASSAFIIMRERIKRQMQQRTEMLAGVSHDLRTPLTRMKLQLAMLGDGTEKEQLSRDVREMEQMVEEYLSFARGEGTETAEEENLSVLLRDVVDAAQRNGTEIGLKTKGNLKVQVKRNRFKRCVTNIVNNAAKYSDTVEIEASRNGRFVEIKVDDGGPGVPKEMRDEVFKPFYRMDSSRNLDSGGAGLGLTIARDIMRGHGGEIRLTDSPLGGLRAILRLPV